MRRNIFVLLQTLLLAIALVSFQACFEERYVTPAYGPYAQPYGSYVQPDYMSQPYGYGPAFEEGRREARERIEGREEREEREEEREEREEHEGRGRERFEHHDYR